jgi:hypothetical protein
MAEQLLFLEKILYRLISLKMAEQLSQVKGHENDFKNLIIRGNIEEPIDLTFVN